MEVREKTKTREALLAAAEALFTQKGYAAAGTREIAEAAGANLAAIKYHFGSKAQLFVEVLRGMMRRREQGHAAMALADEVRTAAEAAAQLCRFIWTLLEDIFSPAGCEICRVLFREILSKTSFDPAMREAIVSSAAEDFMRPVGERVRSVLLKLKSGMSEEERILTTHSIIGQCVFYFTNQLFIERVCGENYLDKDARKRAAEHISRFTLSALGCPQDMIAAACRSVYGTNRTV